MKTAWEIAIGLSDRPNFEGNGMTHHWTSKKRKHLLFSICTMTCVDSKFIDTNVSPWHWLFKWLSFSLYKTVISTVEPSSCSRWTVGFKLNWKLFATLPAHLEPVGIASGGISKTVHRKLKKSQKNKLSLRSKKTYMRLHRQLNSGPIVHCKDFQTCLLLNSTFPLSVHYQLIWKLQFNKEHLFVKCRNLASPQRHGHGFCMNRTTSHQHAKSYRIQRRV